MYVADHDVFLIWRDSMFASQTSQLGHIAIKPDITNSAAGVNWLYVNQLKSPIWAWYNVVDLDLYNYMWKFYTGWTEVIKATSIQAPYKINGRFPL